MDFNPQAVQANIDAKKTRLMRMNWTQPICRKCYAIERPDREPVIVVNAEEETCCMCGEKTNEGIYYRANPNLVPFPKMDKKEQ